MKFSQFFKGMLTLTSLCLIYTHLQVQIFDLAYTAKIKEHKIRSLHEDNGNATYTILKLKSAHNLGGKLLAENSGMQFMDNSQIVRLKTPQATEAQKIALSSAQKRQANPILNFLSLRSQAEAKPQE